MRYYVLCRSDHAEIQSHIVAEVVRAAADGEDRDITLAAALVGENASIVTLAELLATRSGRLALDAWNTGNDSQYDRESDALAADVELKSELLRLVPNAKVLVRSTQPLRGHLKPVPAEGV